MGCCEATNPDFQGVASDEPTPTSWRWPPEDTDLDRRTVVKGMLAATGALAIGSCGPKPEGEGISVRLAFCGQLLCVVP